MKYNMELYYVKFPIYPTRVTKSWKESIKGKWTGYRKRRLPHIRYPLDFRNSTSIRYCWFGGHPLNELWIYAHIKQWEDDTWSRKSKHGCPAKLDGSFPGFWGSTRDVPARCGTEPLSPYDCLLRNFDLNNLQPSPSGPNKRLFSVFPLIIERVEEAPSWLVNA